MNHQSLNQMGLDIGADQSSKEHDYLKFYEKEFETLSQLIQRLVNRKSKSFYIVIDAIFMTKE